MKCSLGISTFLEEISSLSYSIVFLYFFALITEEGFLAYDSLLFFETLHSNGYIFPFLPCISKGMLKILQARLQQYGNREIPDVQAGFRKGRGPRDQIASICWVIEKAREFQKNTSTSALLIMPRSLTVWITTNCEKFFKRWEYQTTWPTSWETCMQVRKQQTGSN